MAVDRSRVTQSDTGGRWKVVRKARMWRFRDEGTDEFGLPGLRLAKFRSPFFNFESVTMLISDEGVPEIFCWCGSSSTS
jgi:hypothetical protein